MEERRFDNLTRVLAGATSRRQVLKGLLGGLALTLVGRAASPGPAAAAEVCNRAQCEQEAFNLWKICQQNCSNLSGRHGYRHSEDIACVLACGTALKIEQSECAHNASGCFANATCCNQQCTSLETDRNNCGACGNVCPPGSSCLYGQCQCGSDEELCDGQCVDTQIDPNHCGDCTTTCGTCNHCVNGQCLPVQCNPGEVCCQNQCRSLCPSGDAPDPTTCQCNVCQGQFDGAACGTNEVCCQEQCLSNQCPSPKQFSLDTCNCQCPPANCPTGQLQDPDTCQCVDLCAKVTCGACETCDPTSGDCVQADDQTPCGSGQVCCSGTCQETCACPEDRQCERDPNDSSSVICCPEGQVCGAESNESGYNTCCPSANICDVYCCADNESCLPGGFCCQSDKVTSDNGCCQSDQTVCGAACCQSNETCIGGSCCNNSQVSSSGECCPFDVCNGQCCGQYQICGSLLGETEHCIDASPL